MTASASALKTVTYTVSGEKSYAVLAASEVETLREVAAKSGGVLVVTGVKTYRVRSVTGRTTRR